MVNPLKEYISITMKFISGELTIPEYEKAASASMKYLSGKELDVSMELYDKIDPLYDDFSGSCLERSRIPKEILKELEEIWRRAD